MRPMLVIMAAGMGSRFGGLKQMTAVDGAGQVILDYSVYDAVRAGFEKVVCVIKKEIEADFRAAVGDRIGRGCELHYAFQDLGDLPAHLHQEIQHFFTVYKSLEPGKESVVNNAHGREEALEVIRKAFDDYVDNFCR